MAYGDSLSLELALAGLFAVLSLVLWFRLRATRLATARDRQALLDRCAALDVERAELAVRLEEERKSAAEREALVASWDQRIEERLKSLSFEALTANNAQFLTLAKENLGGLHEAARGELGRGREALSKLLDPLGERLARLEETNRLLERDRQTAYAGLRTQVELLAHTHSSLREETRNLVEALRSPQAKGRWGELQLRRVAELAGMLAHCDFVDQPSRRDGDGQLLRPDMLVQLPGSLHIVIDAKTPTLAYLAALEADSEAERTAALDDHARQVRGHMTALSRKTYWSQFDPAPEFVVMFLPGESFFSAALTADPSLIEAGAGERVVLASPTTLIALMRTVALAWKQETMSRNSQAIADAGRELFRRCGTFADHMARLGGNLDRAVQGYNEAVGSFERSLSPQARRIAAFDAAPDGAEIKHLTPIDSRSRPMRPTEPTPGRDEPIAPAPEVLIQSGG